MAPKRPADESAKGSSKRQKTGEVFAWEPSAVLASELCGGDANASRAVCRLLRDGCSVPFIARYRRAQTGNMAPDSLREYQDRLEELDLVRDKGSKLLEKAEKLGKLTADLRRSLSKVTCSDELDILAAPFKSESATKTRAAKAIEAGLQTPAMDLLKGKANGRKMAKEVQEGIVDILAEHIAHHESTREKCKELEANTDPVIVSSKAKETKAAKAKKQADRVDDSKYELYMNFSCRASALKPHQAMAINRGEKSKVLSVKVELPQAFSRAFDNFCRKSFVDGVSSGGSEERRKLLSKAIDEGFKRFVLPPISRRVRSRVTRDAEKSALEVFARNLRNMLLTPPLQKDTAVLGVDPGFRNGCKLAAVDARGAVLNSAVIRPDFRGSKKLNSKDLSVLKDAVVRNETSVIAVGNGTACRETEKLVAELIDEGAFGKDRDVSYSIVNEQGASIYSCSKKGLAENPGLTPEAIGAASIARRLQDPLSEYARLEPKHLGVGMYQHDVAEAKLKRNLEEIMVECVSFVGVDLNRAPEHVLTRVAGLSAKQAAAVVAWRADHGRFESRQQLRKVKGVGEAAFKQCAGFVRIAGGSEPLDALLIHPESYDVARKVIAAEKFKPGDVGKENFVGHFKKRLLDVSDFARMADKFATDPETLRLIFETCSKPLTYDIRQDSLSKPVFRRGVTSMDDLVAGETVLSGVVTNVTSFGAFVDIGVGPNGLIHVSQMGSRKPELGNRVDVKVVSVEKQRKRIGLKLLDIK